VIRTEHHTRLDANLIVWINLIQSMTTNCAKMGFIRKKNSENEFGESETFYQSKISRATSVRGSQRVGAISRIS